MNQATTTLTRAASQPVFVFPIEEHHNGILINRSSYYVHFHAPHNWLAYLFGFVGRLP